MFTNSSILRLSVNHNCILY